MPDQPRTRRRSAVGLLAALLVVAATGCDGGEDDIDDATGPAGEAVGQLQVSSSAFSEGEPIPTAHTCDGEDTPPPLSWEGVPDEAESIAILVEDPDAPGGDFAHWLVVDIPPDVNSIEGSAPQQAVEGENSFGTTGWAGPCPPEGDEPHRYHFTVAALDIDPDLTSGFTLQQLENAMRGNVRAQGTLTGTYGR